MNTTSPVRRPRAWVWGFAKLIIRTYYRVDRVGNTLPDGPLLLVANHPNALLDPAVIQTTAGRQVRFLAKSTLFRRHPLSLLIRNSGAIPVYRRMDAGVDTRRNAEMFSAVEMALAEGGAVCLFPEGTSHDRGRLDPLRTGAARMALASTARAHPVTIVPVGLNFDQLGTFRSRVTTVFGRAFDCRDLMTTYELDEPAAVRELTDRISDRLRRLMVEADPRTDLPLVERVDHLYAAARGVSRAPEDRIVRRRLIADGMDRLREQKPEQLEAFLAEVHRYDANLSRFGLRDRDVEQRISPLLVGRFVVRESLLGLLFIPVAALGVTVFAFPYWLTGQIGRRAPDLSSRATWKVVGGALLYGVWIVGISTLVALWVGNRAAAISAGGLTLLAFGGLLAFEREAAVFRTAAAFVALRQTPLKARARLKRQRAALATVLEQVGEWVRSV